MIVYRKYVHENDYDSYKIFCEKNFGKGCYQCSNTGYKGRIGIYELLEMNSDLISALRSNDNQAFADAAVKSRYFRSLAMSALDYAREGVTSLDEVFRVSATLEGEDY